MALGAARYLRGARDVITGREHVYYGWWLLATSTIAMALASGLSMSSFGLYVHPLEDEFGWTRAEVSVSFSVAILCSGFAGPLVGHWIDTRGARSAILIGGALTAVSYLLLSSTQTLWQFYLFHGIHAVCRQMMFFIPFQTLISYWFVRRRGVALSVLGSGFSMGGLIVLPLTAAAIDGLGWRTAYLLSGVLIAAFFLPAALFVIRNRPSDVGATVDDEPVDDTQAPSAAADTASGITLQQALRMPLFWIVALGFMLLFFGMIGWMVHQVPFYESEGFSRATATLIVSLSAGASMVARLAIGVFADRFARFEVAVVFLMGTLAASMAVLLVSTAPLAIVVFQLFWVIGAGAGPMAESMVLIKLFGMRYFATILGAVLVVETLGQIFSPSLAGAIYDDTGSYDGALLMFLLAFLAGMLLFFIASRMRVPDPATLGADEQRAGVLA